jgi:hypothetical protein
MARKAVVRMLRVAVAAITRRTRSLVAVLAPLTMAAALVVPGAGVASAAPASAVNAFSFLPGPGLPSFEPCSFIAEFVAPRAFQEPVQETGGAIDQFRFPVPETKSLIFDFELFAQSCLEVPEG